MKKMLLMALFILSSSCTTTPSKPSVEHGFISAFSGIGQLILSPLQISAGLLEGISAFPYMLSTGIHDINKALIQSKAEISLADTYQYAYQKKLTQVAETGDTGIIFRRMSNATEYFQEILKKHGVYDYQDYLLTSVKSANAKGYTLYAVVYRSKKDITVLDSAGRSRTLSKEDRLYYEPYRLTTQGESLDVIIDWTGIPRTYIQTQKGQALLMTLSANAVLKNQPKHDFWRAQSRWINGEYLAVVDEQAALIKARMGIKKQS